MLDVATYLAGENDSDSEDFDLITWSLLWFPVVADSDKKGMEQPGIKELLHSLDRLL